MTVAVQSGPPPPPPIATSYRSIFNFVYNVSLHEAYRRAYRILSLSLSIFPSLTFIALNQECLSLSRANQTASLVPSATRRLYQRRRTSQQIGAIKWGEIGAGKLQRILDIEK